MSTKSQPELFVVDGSNIATEGRSAPSLAQLNDAVLAFMADRPDVLITVVVDATFGHRIDKSEAEAFDEAVANNELVTPPAGAVGRGDAFVLSIAHKAKAGILSNDSFQEFHGEYTWLFDEGRLIGGKPVPHVGWVFVTRTPVRGPKSRQAVREAKGDASETKKRANRRVKAKSSSTENAEAPAAEKSDEQEPATSSRARGRRRGKSAERAAASSPAASDSGSGTESSSAPSSSQVNELMPFLEFAEHHPVGTSCTGVVESYASHGAYVRVADVLVYVPLRLMESPAPRSARSVLTVGDAISVVIVGYVADRRSIDAALPHMAEGALAEAEAEAQADPDEEAPAAKPAPRRSRSRRAAEPADAPSESSAEPAPKKAPAKKTPAKKAPAKKAPAKKAPAKKAPAKKAPAKKAPAKKAPAKKAPAKKAPAKKAPAKKAPAKKAPAKKAPAKKAPAKKAPAKKAPAKKAAAGTSTSD